MDRLRLSADRAELEIEKAERNLKLAGLEHALEAKEVEAATIDLQRRKIVAPISGVVVAVMRRPGEWVHPGDTVVRVLRIDRLRVEAFLPGDKVAHDLTGSRATLAVDLPGKRREQFSGKIVFVDPEIEPVTGQFRVWAEVANPERLLNPGRHGTLTIELPAPVASSLK